MDRFMGGKVTETSAEDCRFCGFHGPTSPQSRRCRPVLCGLVGLRDSCHIFAKFLNPSLSVFFSIRTGNDLFGRRVAFGLTDL